MQTKNGSAEKVALAEWLSRLHKQAGGNVSALARALDTDRKNVYRWLDGSSEPGGAALLRLLAALGVELTPKPPDEIPRPVNVELRALREELAALTAAVSEQSEALADLARNGASTSPEPL